MSGPVIKTAGTYNNRDPYVDLVAPCHPKHNKYYVGRAFKMESGTTSEAGK